jgi:hypothetical protein
MGGASPRGGAPSLYARALLALEGCPWRVRRGPTPLTAKTLRI